jgi:hypothetical protein
MLICVKSGVTDLHTMLASISDFYDNCPGNAVSFWRKYSSTNDCSAKSVTFETKERLDKSVHYVTECSV